MNDLTTSEIPKPEFIIALTEHRFFGTIFVPYLIRREEQFYRVVRHIKPRDFKTENEYTFQPWEKELVEIIDRYSDERLMKKFSRLTILKEFYSSLQPAGFQKNIIPFIEQCMYRVAIILMVSPVRLLNKDVKYANVYDEDEIEVQPLFVKPSFYFNRTETGTKYRLEIFHDDKKIPLLNRQTRIVTNDPCVFVQNGKMYVAEKLNAKRLTPFFEKEEVAIPLAVEEKYYEGFVLNTVRDFQVQATGFEIMEDEVEKTAVLSLETNLQYKPCFVLYFFYGDEKFLPNSNRTVAVQLEKQKDTWRFIKVNRQTEWEKEIQQKLATLGLKFSDGFFELPAAGLVEESQAVYALISWLGNCRPALDEARIKVVQDRLDKKYFAGSCQLDMQAKISGDWFDVEAVVQFGEFRIPFIKLRKYILNDIREFELPNGEIAVLPEEWFARYKGLLPLAKFTGEKMQFAKHHFGILQSMMQNRVKAAVESLMESGNQENTTLPAGLNARLRNYQEEGFRWMYRLGENGFGGCLADDMGLGKTLQTLTLLLKKKRAKTEIQLPPAFVKNGQLDLFATGPEKAEEQPASLVVVPTSLVHNWVNEIARFTPSLRVFNYTGINRKKASDLQKIIPYYDIILTTYGTLRIEAELFSALNFYYVILDESQFIKNPASKTYKAVLQLRAKHRLVLTGTPIENSLSDLWAQMNFLNPGLLGNMAYFRKMFILPIEKQGSEEQQKMLHLLTGPFILRRRKDEVARELPPLTVHVVYCAMSAEQEKLYEHEKSVIRNAILESIDKEGVKKSSFVVLQGLTKLRQLANHPSLFDKESEDISGKFEQLISMLENLVAEKHKVLIFSSFVTHLKLIEERIQQENWQYSLLTGQTNNREEVISNFQNNPQNFIFLISLKAGGVGLNLTGASYVFITDPWWNPAAENQAIARAHRIGQKKKVFVYRFITENSIEEKIQVLKERKSALADKFVNSPSPFSEITREELDELFA